MNGAVNALNWRNSIFEYKPISLMISIYMKMEHARCWQNVAQLRKIAPRVKELASRTISISFSSANGHKVRQNNNLLSFEGLIKFYIYDCFDHIGLIIFYRAIRSGAAHQSLNPSF